MLQIVGNEVKRRKNRSIPISDVCFIEGWMSSIDAAKQDRAGFQQPTLEAAQLMAANEILEEARKLHTVSESLNALAKQNPPVSKALWTMARTVRNSAMLLELMATLRLGSNEDVEKASN